MRSEYIKSHPARTVYLPSGSFKVSATGLREAIQPMPLVFRTAHLNNSAKGNYRPVLYMLVILYFLA